jgi:hypothetical protein
VDAEQEFVEAFVAKEHRDRWSHGLADPRLRVKLVERLWHRQDWDSRYVTTMQRTGKRPEWLAHVVGELRARGATDHVHVLANDSDLDSTEMPLSNAVDLFSVDGGAVLICLPSKLAIHFQEVGPPLMLAR